MERRHIIFSVGGILVAGGLAAVMGGLNAGHVETQVAGVALIVIGVVVIAWIFLTAKPAKAPDNHIAMYEIDEIGEAIIEDHDVDGPLFKVKSIGKLESRRVRSKPIK